MPTTRRASRASRKAPLAGLRVVSLAEQYPGPFATLILSDLGADVVLVERVAGGDPSRRDPPFFAALNRDKRSVALDLKRPEGRDAVLRLARKADVLLEGFRPGTMDRLGLGYRDVSRANPRVVYVSLSGFGHTGPYRDVPGHDLSFQALAGLLHREIGESRPALPWLPLGNLAGGLFAVIETMAALRARDSSGRGSHVDVAILDALVSLVTVPLATRGRASELRDPGYGLFAAKDGALVALSVWGEDHLWAALCRSIGLDRYASMTFAQRARAPRLAAALRRAIAARPLADWSKEWRRAGVPFAPVNDLEGVVRDPQVKARRAVRTSRRGPRLGEHTRELLREAGYDARRIDALVASGVAAEG